MGAIPRELEVVVRDRFWRRCSGVVVQLWCLEAGDAQLGVTGRTGAVSFLVPDVVATVTIVVDGVRQEFAARDDGGCVRQIAITR